MILLDITSTFDTLDYNILITRIIDIGIRDIAFVIL